MRLIFISNHNSERFHGSVTAALLPPPRKELKNALLRLKTAYPANCWSASFLLAYFFLKLVAYCFSTQLLLLLIVFWLLFENCLQRAFEMPSFGFELNLLCTRTTRQLPIDPQALLECIVVVFVS